MNKTIKKGLKILGTVASTTLCALTLAYSQPSTDVKPYSIEKAAEVYGEYVFILKNAKVNSILAYDTIQNLNNYLEKNIQYMPNSKEEIKNIVNYINNKREKEAEYVCNGHEENEELKKEYNVLQGIIERTLEYSFPGLIKKDIGIVYPSTQQLEEKPNLLLKSCIRRAEKSLKKRKDESLAHLVEKEQLTIQDVVAFYTIFKKQEHLYIERKEILKKVRKPDINFVNYLEHKKAFKDFLNDVEKWKKVSQIEYFSAGAAYYYYRDIIREDVMSWKESRISNETDKNLEKALGCKLYPVEEIIPPKTTIPPWLGIILGIGGPLVIKGFIAKYTRRKWDELDAWELGSGVPIGTLIFDLIHPWVCPIRLFALPLITEFLGKGIRKYGK